MEITKKKERIKDASHPRTHKKTKQIEKSEEQSKKLQNRQAAEVPLKQVVTESYPHKILILESRLGSGPQ